MNHQVKKLSNYKSNVCLCAYRRELAERRRLLSKQNQYDNNLLLYDDVLKKDNEVTLRGGALFCDYHATENGHSQYIEFVNQ